MITDRYRERAIQVPLLLRLRTLASPQAVLDQGVSIVAKTMAIVRALQDVISN